MTKTTGLMRYRLIQRKDPIRQELKYYGQQIPARSVDWEDFISHMAAHNSPYSRGVIAGVLTDMLDCLQEMVLDGKSVRFGDLGIFSLSLNTAGADTRGEWESKMIKKVRLVVRNTKTWSNTELTKRTRFELMDDDKEEADAEETL